MSLTLRAPWHLRASQQSPDFDRSCQTEKDLRTSPKTTCMSLIHGPAYINSENFTTRILAAKGGTFLVTEIHVGGL